MNLHDSCIMKLLKKIYSCFAAIAPETATKILFKKYLGYGLDLKNPHTLNLKCNILSLEFIKIIH